MQHFLFVCELARMYAQERNHIYTESTFYAFKSLILFGAVSGG